MGYLLPTITSTSIPASGQPVDLGTQHSGVAIIYNFSNVCLGVYVDSPSTTKFIPALTADVFEFGMGQRFLTVQAVVTLTIPGAATNIIILVDQDVTAAQIGGSWPLYLGGIVSVAGLNTLINDGNPAGTTIVEATPSGALSSDVTLTNDGKLFLNGPIEFGASSGFASTPTAIGAIWVSGGTNAIFSSPLSGAGGGVGFATWSGSGRLIPFSVGGQVGSAPTYLDGSGVVKQVAGQATAGSFGVPVVVAQAIEQNIVVTTLVDVLTYAVPVTGLYRVSSSFCCHNGANSSQPLLHVDYTGGSHGVTVSNSMVGSIGGTAAQQFNGGFAVNDDADFSTFPEAFYVKSGTNLVCRYRQQIGTPNDFVSFVVERLA